MCAIKCDCLANVTVGAAATPPSPSYAAHTHSHSEAGCQSAIALAIVLAIQISQRSAARARKCMPNVALIFMPEPILNGQAQRENTSQIISQLKI